MRLMPLRRERSLCQVSRELIYTDPLGFTGQVCLCCHVLLPLRWNPKSKAKCQAAAGGGAAAAQLIL